MDWDHLHPVAVAALITPSDFASDDATRKKIAKFVAELTGVPATGGKTLPINACISERTMCDSQPDGLDTPIRQHTVTRKFDRIGTNAGWQHMRIVIATVWLTAAFLFFIHASSAQEVGLVANLGLCQANQFG